jgi:hypothetical protein
LFADRVALLCVNPTGLHLLISASTIADMCGWTKARQSKIESGNVISVSDGAAKKLATALVVPINQVFVLVNRFRANDSLMDCRRYFGFAMNRFSKMCGWSVSRQRQIEAGCGISQQTMETIASKLVGTKKKHSTLVTPTTV